MPVGADQGQSNCLAVFRSSVRHLPLVLSPDTSWWGDPGSPLRVRRARKEEPKASLCPVLSWLVLVSRAHDEGAGRRLGMDQGSVPSPFVWLTFIEHIACQMLGRFRSARQCLSGSLRATAVETNSLEIIKGGLRGEESEGTAHSVCPLAPASSCVSPLYPPSSAPLLSLQPLQLFSLSSTSCRTLSLTKPTSTLLCWHLKVKSTSI